MQTAQKTVLNIGIYFSDTGGGHRSAARGVKGGIESIVQNELSSQLDAHIHLEAIAEKVHPLTQLMTRLYNHMARHNLTLIKYYYRLLHVIHPEADFFYNLYRPYLHQLLLAHKPSIIVSAHPMLGHSLTRAVQELGLGASVKVVVVVTDPNERLWRAWACRRADLIIAPNDAAAERLLGWQIEPEKLKVLGMPIHPEFLAPPLVPRGEFLESLGLAGDVFTVCVNAGWAGNAHLEQIYAALTRCGRKLQVIFLSGYNHELETTVARTANGTGIPTVVLPFTDQMPELMSAVDVMITKAGGLTTYEALARRLPLILDKTIEPMPQEASTLEMLVNAGMAQALKRTDDIVEIIDKMPFPQSRRAALPAQYQLDLTDHAVFDIARAILQLAQPQLELQVQSQPQLQLQPRFLER